MTNKDLKRFYNRLTQHEPLDFARYDLNGRLQAESPLDNHDVATKIYVDTAVQSALSGEEGDYSNVHDFTEIRSAVHEQDTIGITITYDNDGKILIPLEGSEYINVDVDESNKAISIRLDKSVVDQLHKLALHDLTFTQTDGYFDSNETIAANTHIHVLFEVETAGTHAGADFVLHPYNGSVCNVCFTLLIGGQYVNGFASINGESKIHISFENLTEQISEIEAHYQIL